ncbi:MAG: hypothetical protein HUU20_22170 [Pirellulales bacterium]|nr:hypothetical protein [Pirellulales bacterium]
MAASICFQEQIEIPFVRTLGEFRAWVTSGNCPDIPEFWLADARGSELVFRIHRAGSAGYEPAPSDAEGFQYSAVLNQWFRLLRRRRRTGRWAYALEQKHIGNTHTRQQPD